MKRVLVLIAASALMAAAVASIASAKGQYTSDIFYVTRDYDFSQAVTEKGLGHAPLTVTSHANGLEKFFCADGRLAGSTSWNASDEVTVTPEKSKATAYLFFSRPRIESSFTCSDNSTPSIGYVLYSDIVVTDNYGKTLTIPDQTLGTP
jgi:hypothetical protein